MKVVEVVVNPEPEKSDKYEALVLAFRLGCDLHDYLSWAEAIWGADQSDAQMRIDGPLKRLSTSMLTLVDRLSSIRSWRRSVERKNVANCLNQFPGKLLTALDLGERREILARCESLEWLMSEVLTPTDFPCDESEEYDSLRQKLFYSPLVDELRDSSIELVDVVGSQVKLDLDLLTFFRLGFEVVRRSNPLILDPAYPVEPSRHKDASHETKIELSLERLIQDARIYHSGLDRVDLFECELRERIETAINCPSEECERFDKGLKLYPGTCRVGRDGFKASFSLAGSSAAWSLLKVLAKTTNGTFVTKDVIEENYAERILAPKEGKDGVEKKRRPLGQAILRLNKKHLQSIGLKATGKTGGRGYQLIEWSPPEN